MLPGVDVPLGAFSASFKAGHERLSNYAYELEVSEERSSDEDLDLNGHSMKLASQVSRPVGMTSSACRGPSRHSMAPCASWVPAFLSSQYFQPCERHRHHKKNECTFFCISCGIKPQSICQHCMGSHAGHQVIQVRRYVYCDVVRTCDINPYVDTTGVQNYIINSAKVMFLNHRPHSKIGRATGVDICRTCHRHLREGYSYCSLACKVEALTKGEASICPLSTSAGSCGLAAVPPSVGSGFPSRRTLAGTSAGGSVSGILPCIPRPRIQPFSGAEKATVPAGAPQRNTSLAAAAAAAAALSREVAAAAAAAAATAAMSSDPESSEPCDDVIPFGTGSAALLGRHRRPPGTATRDVYGSASASSEDDCCDFNFENPPKRRRSALAGRRPSSNGSSAQDCFPTLANAAKTTAAAAAAAEANAAANAAAAALLLPFQRAASGSLSRRASGSVPPENAATGAEPSIQRSSAPAAPPPSPSSRRKQNAPQRAPSC